MIKMRKLTVKQFVKEIGDLDTFCQHIDNNVFIVVEKDVDLEYMGHVDVKDLNLTVYVARDSSGEQFSVKLPSKFKCKHLSITAGKLTLPEHLDVKNLYIHCHTLLSWPSNLVELNKLTMNVDTHCELPSELKVLDEVHLTTDKKISLPRRFSCKTLNIVNTNELDMHLPTGILTAVYDDGDSIKYTNIWAMGEIGTVTLINIEQRDQW